MSTSDRHLLPLEASQVQALLRGEMITVVTRDERLEEFAPFAEEWTIREDGGWVAWRQADSVSLGRVYPPHTQGAVYAVGEAIYSRQDWLYQFADEAHAMLPTDGPWPDDMEGIAPPWTSGRTLKGAAAYVLPADQMPIEAARLYVRCVSVEVKEISLAMLHVFSVGHRGEALTGTEHVFVSTFEPVEKP